LGAHDALDIDAPPPLVLSEEGPIDRVKTPARAYCPEPECREMSCLCTRERLVVPLSRSQVRAEFGLFPSLMFAIHPSIFPSSYSQNLLHPLRNLMTGSLCPLSSKSLASDMLTESGQLRRTSGLRGFQQMLDRLLFSPGKKVQSPEDCVSIIVAISVDGGVVFVCSCQC